MARTAVRQAAIVRAEHGIGPTSPLCPYDLAERLGLVVRLVAIPSLEGMYSPGSPATVLVSALRPAGRRRYSCAHELAHHVFGHGTRLDERSEISRGNQTAEEYLAQRFAGAVLMPKFGIDAALARRGCSLDEATPETLFLVAQEFGVGYLTLILHLERTLLSLESGRASVLRRVKLPTLRRELASFDIEHDVIPVDDQWRRETVDAEVGDVVTLPKSATFRGRCATLRSGPVHHLRAVRPGVGTFVLSPGDTGSPPTAG